MSHLPPNMTLRSQADQQELVDRISSALARDGGCEPKPGIHLRRQSQPGDRVFGVSEPSFCVIAQGRKAIFLGDQIFHYDAANYLVTTLELPLSGEVVEASPQKPYLSFRLILDPAVVTSIMVDTGLAPNRGEAGLKAVDVSSLDANLLDATLRLVRLLDSPSDYHALAPLVTREIVYRLLHGAQAGRMRHLAKFGGHAHRIARAVGKLRTSFDQPLRIDALAKDSGMSVSGFHAHFRAATAMSPLQFQKQLRLHEARRLMLSEDCDAAQAGFRVGYEDASQFNREYKRQFGEPPMRDVERLRKVAVRAPIATT